MDLGDVVKFKMNDNWVQGTIVNIYIVPKDYNLVDIQLEDGTIVYGIETDQLIQVD